MRINIHYLDSPLYLGFPAKKQGHLAPVLKKYLMIYCPVR